MASPVFRIGTASCNALRGRRKHLLHKSQLLTLCTAGNYLGGGGGGIHIVHQSNRSFLYPASEGHQVSHMPCHPPYKKKCQSLEKGSHLAVYFQIRTFIHFPPSGTSEPSISSYHATEHLAKLLVECNQPVL